MDGWVSGILYPMLLPGERLRQVKNDYENLCAVLDRCRDTNGYTCINTKYFLKTKQISPISLDALLMRELETIFALISQETKN